eukprot:gb/GECG01000943.1/.p1 GENE.gb/GECG01000943.1/~~gb/GECG01000943.1/.p1  ORF type:complete len:410 (+),score=19.11 gb/GECG01000943.1/:1-1230(+)
MCSDCCLHPVVLQEGPLLWVVNWRLFPGLSFTEHKLVASSISVLRVRPSNHRYSLFQRLDHMQSSGEPPKRKKRFLGRVKRACIPCASRKLKCDGQRPCTRCVQKQRISECVDTDTKTHLGKRAASTERFIIQRAGPSLVDIVLESNSSDPTGTSSQNQTGQFDYNTRLPSLEEAYTPLGSAEGLFSDDWLHRLSPSPKAQLFSGETGLRSHGMQGGMSGSTNREASSIYPMSDTVSSYCGSQAPQPTRHWSGPAYTHSTRANLHPKHKNVERGHPGSWSFSESTTGFDVNPKGAVSGRQFHPMHENWETEFDQCGRTPHYDPTADLTVENPQGKEMQVLHDAEADESSFLSTASYGELSSVFTATSPSNFSSSNCLSPNDNLGRNTNHGSGNILTREVPIDISIEGTK